MKFSPLICRALLSRLAAAHVSQPAPCPIQAAGKTIQGRAYVCANRKPANGFTEVKSVSDLKFPDCDKH